MSRLPIDTETRNAIAPGCRAMATRIDNAESAMVECIATLGGVSSDAAARVFRHYRKIKVVRLDAVSGRYRVTHGAFLDRDVIAKAVVESAAK